MFRKPWSVRRNLAQIEALLLELQGVSACARWWRSSVGFDGLRRGRVSSEVVCVVLRIRFLNEFPSTVVL